MRLKQEDHPWDPRTASYIPVLSRADLHGISRQRHPAGTALPWSPAAAHLLEAEVNLIRGP